MSEEDASGDTEDWFERALREEAEIAEEAELAEEAKGPEEAKGADETEGADEAIGAEEAGRAGERAESGDSDGVETDEGGATETRQEDDSAEREDETPESLFGGTAGGASDDDGDDGAGGSGFEAGESFGQGTDDEAFNEETSDDEDGGHTGPAEEEEDASPDQPTSESLFEETDVQASNDFGFDVEEGGGSFGEASDAGEFDTGEFDTDEFGTDAASDDMANPWANDTEVTGGGGGPFDDEGFASAFESGGGGEGEFEDEDFESAIPRIDIGIEGLDAMIHGGVPERHLIVAIGGAGTGKTTFGLQFLHHGLTQGENCVFITLEQSHESILATANEWGWDFEHYESQGSLAVVDLDPVEMANSLDNIQAELPALIENFGADRLVLDSVSLLEMMYEDQAKRRTEVYDFTRSLKKGGVTTFLTSEASETNPYASRFGVIEYLTDAVFVLKFVRGETQETRLAIEIQKIRNANHSREMKPYELTDEGISVYRQANIF